MSTPAGAVRGTRDAEAVMALLRGRSDLALDELTAVVRQAQEAMNTWAAVQLFALAQLAATDDVLVDGVWVEAHRGLGHVRLDAPALVSAELGMTDRAAGDRVGFGVRLSTAAPRLLAAMESGALDGWRAGVVVRELDGASAEVCAAVTAEVVESLGDRLCGMPAGRLRSTTRRILNRVEPELLATRQAQARADRDLRRWCDVDGQDVWEVRLTPEQARPAFAAVEATARELRAADSSLSVGQARADGMVALVLGHSVGRYVVRLAIPEPMVAELSAPRPSASRRTGVVDGAGRTAELLVQVSGMGVPSGTTTVTRSWLQGVLSDPDTRVVPSACRPDTGALAVGPDAVEGYVPTEALRTWVRDRDGGCRFPGCTIGARFCDINHVIAWPTGTTSPENLMCLCRRHHQVKQRPRWRVSLTPEGIVRWTDPLGRVRVTLPVDHLQAGEEPVVAAAEPTPRAGPWHPRDLASGGLQPAPGLEHHLEWLRARGSHRTTGPHEAPGRHPRRLRPPGCANNREGVIVRPRPAPRPIETTFLPDAGYGLSVGYPVGRARRGPPDAPPF